jgi:membrane protein YdbS with pleckstrin-like domain
MNLARRTLIIIFFLVLLFDFLFWLLAIASGHNIPKETTGFILITAVILILLIVLTYKYLRPNDNNTFEK